MANSSLTAEPCSHNDVTVISFLSGLIESSHRYYTTHNDISVDDFICPLRTVVGLGFTAWLAAGNNAMDYQAYYFRFIQNWDGDPASPTVRPQFADSITWMVELALRSFCTLDYPDYYKSFTQAIAQVINKPEVKTSTQSEQAQQLLELLNKKSNGG